MIKEHDTSLTLRICNGLRPTFRIKIPQLLEDLIKRCWDNDPKLRPGVRELYETLRDWYYEIKGKKNTEFIQQIQIVGEYNQSLPKEIRFPKYEIHQGAFYISKPINTKQISELLSKDYSLELKLQNATDNSEITNELDIKNVVLPKS